MEQGLYKLKDKKRKSANSIEVKTAYMAMVEPFNTPSPYLSLLTNPFAFNLSFSILPDVISDNTPISFL